MTPQEVNDLYNWLIWNRRAKLRQARDFNWWQMGRRNWLHDAKMFRRVIKLCDILQSSPPIMPLLANGKAAQQQVKK
jgi:hypothetical protein